MLPISKNQNRKTYRNTLRKVFNLALLALVLIIWSCSTTETTSAGSPSGIDRIELYEDRVPLIYTGTNADGTPNANLLLSGFVKYPADGRLLNFTVTNNPYMSIETNSTDLFEYSMLRVLDPDLTDSTFLGSSSSISIGVVVTAKNGLGRTNLIITSESLAPPNPGFYFGGLNRRVVSTGCQVRSRVVVYPGSNTAVYNWYQRFADSDANIHLSGNGLFNRTRNWRSIVQANDFSGLSETANDNSTGSITRGIYTVENTPPTLVATDINYPMYSSLTFTIPRPNDPAFADTSNPTKAKVSRGIAMRFLVSTISTEEIVTKDEAIDYQCNLVDLN